MGAYNWILVDADCPACSSRTRIRCQTHVASDYGGIGGRFFDREFTLGQTMPWWPRDHPQWTAWQLPGGDAVTGEEFDEACYSSCTACGAELAVVIHFEHCTPTSVLSVSREEDWPDGYPR